MLVIPAINARDYNEASQQMEVISGFLPQDGWVHVDVCGGKFTPARTWDNPDELTKLLALYKDIKVEAHLMIDNPDEAAESWLEAGAKRIIVQKATVKDFNYIVELARKYNAEAVLSLLPQETNMEEELKLFAEFQVLAVPPGFAGQSFNMHAVELVKLLRSTFPNAKIEVDGGINLETAKLVKSAGANMVVSASYILASQDPEKAYQDLSAL